GIVQAMHQLDGIAFLVFAERGLWNRFVPSLDGYIQDRLNNPIHLPSHGTLHALRLEAPGAELVRRVVESRLRPALEQLGDPGGPSLGELWDQELRSARRKLEPEGALTGATRELQAGLGAFLRLGHEHGVKVGPWRLHHVVPEWTFGEHPTFGVLSIAHWVCK